MLLGRIEKKLKEIGKEQQEDEIEVADPETAKTVVKIVKVVRMVSDKYFSKSTSGWFKFGSSSSESDKLIVSHVEQVIEEASALLKVQCSFP